jgi:hypothetical protein
MLADQDRQKLDGIVQQMQTNKEPDTNIQAVVNDFKTKYDSGNNTSPAPTASPAPDTNNGGIIGGLTGGATFGGKGVTGVSDFLGTSKFGLGMATAALTASGQGNQSGDAEGAAAHQLSAIMAKYPIGSPERKAAVQNYMNLYKGGVTTQAQIDPGTQLSDKEVLGSAGNVALDVMGGGELTSGAEFGGTIATKAPALMDALNTGTQVINKVVAPIEAAGAGGRIANAFIKGGEFGLAQGVTQGANNNESAPDIAKSAAKGSLLNSILSGGVQGATELGKYLTSPAVSESLYNRAIGIDKKTALADRSPSASMIEQGKVGTATGLMNDAQKTIDATNGQIKQVLANDTTQHDTAGLIEQMRAQLTQKYGDTLGPEGVQALMDQLPIAKMKSNSTLTTPELNSLRQKIDSDFIGNGKWLSINQDPVKISAFKTAADVLRQTVQGQDARLPGLYDTLSQSITARNALDSQLAKPHALAHMLEIMTGLGGAGEALMTHNPSAAAAGLGSAALFHAGNSTLGQTAGAVGLNKANQALENPGLASKITQTVGRVLGRRAVANTTSSKSR